MVIRGAAGWLVVVLALATLPGCKREAPGSGRKSSPASSSSGAEQLDGMQLDSARRIAIESASAAMTHHNLERLKQLSTWVRGRAQVVILEPNDLEALDLAIACLEQPSGAADSLARLDRIQGGKLKGPAHTACEGGASP
jgi:hypothetical protein